MLDTPPALAQHTPKSRPLPAWFEARHIGIASLDLGTARTQPPVSGQVQSDGVQLEQPATYLIATQTSTYLVDTGTMRAYREPRQQAATPGPSNRPLFTDGSPLVLVSLPEVDIGLPMRLQLTIAQQFLDRPEEETGTPMVTTAVTRVVRLA